MFIHHVNGIDWLEGRTPKQKSELLFDSMDDFILYMDDNEDLNAKLKDQRIKMMFVLGVSTIAALIIFHKTKAKENVSE